MSKLNNSNSGLLSPELAMKLIADLQAEGKEIPAALQGFLPSEHGTITVLVRRNGWVFSPNQLIGTVVSTDCEVVTAGRLLSKEAVGTALTDFRVTVNLTDFPSEIAEEDPDEEGRKDGWVRNSYEVTFELSEPPKVAARNSASSTTEMQLIANAYRISKFTVSTGQLYNFGDATEEEIVGLLREQGQLQRMESADALSLWAASQTKMEQAAAPQEEEVESL